MNNKLCKLYGCEIAQLNLFTKCSLIPSDVCNYYNTVVETQNHIPVDSNDL